ncbi:hypothetical protein DAEQUDRAFT_710102 [Daedalea quercina L-15889]|uniref:CHAT domain-containing protein n=1 Tax=Daedalea quercina L-15889 TaxID=1314783 RepID=A0A165QJT7_9APHY|nr:hypothetical protein DAEQUDRAFT_710102 [Daedalea quercina L-15889]
MVASAKLILTFSDIRVECKTKHPLLSNSPQLFVELRHADSEEVVDRTAAVDSEQNGEPPSWAWADGITVQGIFSLVELMVVLKQESSRQDMASIDVSLFELQSFPVNHRFIRELYEVDEDGPSLLMTAICNVVVLELFEDPNPLPPPTSPSSETQLRHTSYAPGLQTDYSDVEAYRMISDAFTQEEIVDMIYSYTDIMHLPDSDPDKASRLHAIGLLLHVQYRLHGDVYHIQDAVTAQETATSLLPDSHADKPAWLMALGKSLHALFQKRGFEDIILRSISAFRKAVTLTPNGDAERPDRLAKLAAALYVHYTCFYGLAYLQEALELMDEVTMNNSEHLNLASWLSAEAAMHLALFQHLGHMNDLDNSIGCYEVALQNLHNTHADKAYYLSQAGSAFHTRFRRLGRLPDIERALVLHKQAVEMTLKPDVKADRLVVLANALHSAYGFNKNIVNLENGIKAARSAVEMTDQQHPRRSSMLNTLAKLLREHFEIERDTEDIDEAVNILKHEAHMTPTDHPEFKVATMELGLALMSRFQHQHKVADIARAIEEFKDTLLLTSINDPMRPAMLINLGDAMVAQYTITLKLSNIESAVEHFSTATTSGLGAPAIRLSSAMKWATTLQKYGLSSPLTAYKHALDLLSQVAWLGLPMTDRYAQIMPYNDLVCNAAATAIKEGCYDTALEWLEQGRSIVWGQILQLRSTVDELNLNNPDLAQRFIEVSKELEILSNPQLQIPQEHSLSVEESEQRHRSLAQTWEHLVEQIQHLEGFEDFLRPQTATQLMKAALHGPVVLINISEQSCDALILMPQSDVLQHVALTDFSMSIAKSLQLELHEYLENAGINVRKERAAKQVRISDRETVGFSEILTTLWRLVVFPIIEKMGLQAVESDALPHIFWCLTGPLTFLPLHAAGLYESRQPNLKLSDFAISSYTPSLTALLVRIHWVPVNEPRLLVVCQTCTPGQAPLYAAEAEVKAIRQCMGQCDSLAIEVLSDDAATVEKTVSSMEDCNWLHLACHGVQDMNAPTSSAILLWDGKLTLAEVIKKSLSKAELAFLSACETATGDNKLSEEAIHLAAGMLLSGFKGVIATMWSIQDEDGPVMAKEVYTQLLDGRMPNAMRAAHALHDAVLRLQEQGASFERWVPFIHMGI